MWGLIYIHTVKFVMDILRPTIDGGGIKLWVTCFDFTCPLLDQNLLIIFKNF